MRVYIHVHVRVIKGRCPRAHARSERLRARAQRMLGLKKNEWNKWKNQMKGDVGMSLHEKERNKKMPTPRHKVTHNPIPTSLCLPRQQRNIFRRQLDVKMFCCLLCLMHS